MFFGKFPLVLKKVPLIVDKHETSTDIAILLLAKKEGPEWTYKNIIQGGLLQMIVDKIHPSTYDAFTLLGEKIVVFRYIHTIYIKFNNLLYNYINIVYINI